MANPSNMVNMTVGGPIAFIVALYVGDISPIEDFYRLMMMHFSLNTIIKIIVAVLFSFCTSFSDYRLLD